MNIVVVKKKSYMATKPIKDARLFPTTEGNDEFVVFEKQF